MISWAPLSKVKLQADIADPLHAVFRIAQTSTAEISTQELSFSEARFDSAGTKRIARRT